GNLPERRVDDGPVVTKQTDMTVVYQGENGDGTGVEDHVARDGAAVWEDVGVEGDLDLAADVKDVACHAASPGPDGRASRPGPRAKRRDDCERPGRMIKSTHRECNASLAQLSGNNARPLYLVNPVRSPVRHHDPRSHPFSDRGPGPGAPLRL